MLEYLSKDENGNYTKFNVQSASAAYQALNVDGGMTNSYPRVKVTE